MTPTGVNSLITVVAQSGEAVATGYTITQNPINHGAFDGADDTLVGITNNTGATLTKIVLTSTAGLDIGGFDGDGACTGGYSPSPTAAQCGGAFTTTDPQDYAGAGVTLVASTTHATNDTVTVNFSLTNGSSTFFSLEEALTLGSILVPPTFTKAFSPSTIVQSQTSTLTFTITNPNLAAVTGVAFTDTLPTGMTLVSFSSSTCSGGNVATSPTSVSLSGATLAASGSCAIAVIVQATGSGSLVNTTSTLTSIAPAAPPATATLTVIPLVAPTLTKAFSPSTVFQSQTSTLTITITNPNAAPLVGLALTDALPAGITGVSLLSNTCGGTDAL